MTTCLKKSCSSGLLCVSFANVYQSMCASFPFCFEGQLCDLNLLVPDHFLSSYFSKEILSAEDG